MFHLASSLRPAPLLVALVLTATACTSNNSTGFATGGATSTPATVVGSSGDADPDPPTGSVVVAALAASEFVNAAISDNDAASLLAGRAYDDPSRGAPFDPGLLAARLVELEAFEGTVGAVRPSLSAYPDGGDDLAPSCTRSAGLLCQVDLIGSSQELLASVIVYWFADGVTDFSIVTRSSDGVAMGVGEARCSNGSELIHGGHTPDRFDIAVCIDDTGAVEYNGKVRHSDLGIQLGACQDGADRWEATNEGFRYLVDGSGSTTRSSIEVFDPDGELIQSEPFTSVRFDHPAAPAIC